MKRLSKILFEAGDFFAGIRSLKTYYLNRDFFRSIGNDDEIDSMKYFAFFSSGIQMITTLGLISQSLEEPRFYLGIAANLSLKGILYFHSRADEKGIREDKKRIVDEARKKIESELVEDVEGEEWKSGTDYRFSDEDFN